MANLKAHEANCLREHGEPFTYAHAYLDELFRYVGPDHRGFRHNQRGIKEVKRKWGHKAAMAAEIHIKREQEGLILTSNKERDWTK